ncbi:MAG: hypothetical protein LBT12_04320, partial [Oscillospiraceae bacterium]|nr:hypothetical protein [Oscillospiraceae bacterium]
NIVPTGATPFGSAHFQGGAVMPDYEKLYHIMFNAATDAERLLARASETIREAQRLCEELYVIAEEYKPEG